MALAKYSDAMSEGQKLLGEIESFLEKRQDVTVFMFGLHACGNTKLVPRLKAGGSVGIEAAARVRQYIADNTPKKKRRHAVNVAMAG